MHNKPYIKQRELAKLITQIENGSKDSDTIIKELELKPCNTMVIGITGPPGVGKSTLLDQLIRKFRKEDKTVAVIAIDPTSFISGGALLGDRIRMQKNSVDPKVFIRSMATRGHLGGLNEKTGSVVSLLKHAGFDIIIVETVGVGQTEVEIIKIADTVVALTSPTHGDEIQMMKAGVYEIADIIVLNKCDYKGAERIFRDLSNMAHSFNRKREVLVIKMIAVEQNGVSELVEELNARMENG
jgi:LAO/AO transport system kinase